MRVLELGDDPSAGYCGKNLARWGAEVIKVELPRGDATRKVGPFKDEVPHQETSALYLYLNGGKKSITLNFASLAGAKLLAKLADKSDLIISSLSPALVRQLDLEGYAERHPEKVVASITTFGLSGPYSHYESTVGVALAQGGYMYLMGDPDREPLSMPGWYPSYQAGIHAYIGALAAWLGRSERRIGKIVEVSTVEVLCNLHQFTTVQYTYGGIIRSRHGNRFHGLHPDVLMQCKDGWIGFASSTLPFWQRFCLMIGHPEMGEDPRFHTGAARYPYADEIDAVMAPWFREQTVTQLFSEAQEVWRLAIGPLISIPNLLNDRHLLAREFWQEVDHPVAGKLKYPSSPFRTGQSPPTERRAPMLGEHNGEVYGELLDLTREEQTRLRQMGVI